MKTKIIAMYLPQYHRIPENDEFWGKGFTDWVTVKKAKPLFQGHKQPRIPLDENYYDLSQKDSVVWQCQLARKYGIYGFGIYHYWFNNEKNLLTKPAEIIRDNKDIDINYFFTWDNCNWKRSWSNVHGNDWSPVQDKMQDKKGPAILIPYILGKEPDWTNHYNALRSYFSDSRYIKIHNKPVFSIINYNEEIARMCSYWDDLAKEDGFDGVFFIFKNGPRVPKHLYRYSYEPHHIAWGSFNLLPRAKGFIKRRLHIKDKLKIFDSNKIWIKLLKYAEKCREENLFYGAFIGYDDTPRRGKRGKIVNGSTPQGIEGYLRRLLKISTEQNKEFVFFTAWNEWGEGAYLEPDNKSGFSYLEAIKKALTI